jgi:hypothetical protein
MGNTQAFTRVSNVTKFIFWIAFLAFLSTSIPHVAWLYHVYEPVGKGDTVIFGVSLWWVLCYAIAVGIDVLIAWLSFVQTMKKGDFVTWIFIALLSILSWYANYLYDMSNNPVSHQNIWKITLLWGNTTTGAITPIIVSAVPVFVVAYTFMLSRIQTSSVSLSAEELKVQNDHEEKLLAEKVRQATLKRGARSSAIKGAITGIADVASFAIKTVQIGLQGVQEKPQAVSGVQGLQDSTEGTQGVQEAPRTIIQEVPTLPSLDIARDTEPKITTLPVTPEPGKTNGHTLSVYKPRSV